MGEVGEYMGGLCPGCGEYNVEKDWILTNYGNEISAGKTNYSIGKGLIGGALFGPIGTVAGFSHSKGSLKGKRVDTYKCSRCGYTKARNVNIYW